MTAAPRRAAARVLARLARRVAPAPDAAAPVRERMQTLAAERAARHGTTPYTTQLARDLYGDAMRGRSEPPTIT